MTTTTKIDNVTLMAALVRASNDFDKLRDTLSENSTTNIDCLVRLRGQITVGEISIRKDAGNPRTILASLLGFLPNDLVSEFVNLVLAGKLPSPMQETVELANTLVKTTQKETIVRPALRGKVEATIIE